MLKKFCFLSRSPTHHSLTFNLRFLYELKHLKVLVSKTVCVEFPVFDSVSFSLNFIFFFNKKKNALTLKRHDSFKSCKFKTDKITYSKS